MPAFNITKILFPFLYTLTFIEGYYEDFTSLKAKGKKVMLSLGGWSDSAGDKYSKLVNNPENRKAFVQQAVSFLKENNFDGLEMDWEFPVCWQMDCLKGPSADREGFSDLVLELSKALHDEGMVISAAVAASSHVASKAYNVQVLSDNLDFVTIMAYDYHGHWDKQTGHVAPLYLHKDDVDPTLNIVS